jgi:chromosome partitioning protein
MKIITILNSKGGVGKSTILSNIISQSYEMHFKVIYADLDKQKSLSIWAKKNKNLKNIDPEKFDKKEIIKNSDNDFLFIDSPASIKEKLLKQLIELSDTIIIPTSDSNIELNACKKFLKRINKFKRVLKKKVKVIPIINRIRYSKKIHDIKLSSELIIKENFGAWFPMTKQFDNQMSKGSWIGVSSYKQKKLVAEELVKLIKSF